MNTVFKSNLKLTGQTFLYTLIISFGFILYHAPAHAAFQATGLYTDNYQGGLTTLVSNSRAKKEAELAKYKRWLKTAKTPSYVKSLERKIANLEKELGHNNRSKSNNSSSQKKTSNSNSKNKSSTSRAQKEAELAKYKRWLPDARSPDYVRSLERKIANLEKELGHSSTQKNVNSRSSQKSSHANRSTNNNKNTSAQNNSNTSRAQKEAELAKYKRWMKTAKSPDYVRSLERKIANLEKELGHSSTQKNVNIKTQKTDQYSKQQAQHKKFDEDSKQLVGRVTGNGGHSSAKAAPAPSCNASGRTIRVNNDGAFMNALRNAQCGTTIQVDRGSYRSSDGKFPRYVANKNCSRSNPLVIRSNNNISFPGSIHIRGSYIVLRNFNFAGGSIKVTGSNHLVTNNILNRPRYVGIRLVDGVRNNNIVNNTVRGFQSRGIEIQTGQGRSRNDTNNRIAFNLLEDVSGSGNGHEAIRVLSDSAGTRMNTIIEYNYMDRVHADGEGEAISMKTSGNIIRGNTLANSSPSSLVNRNANNNLYENNLSLNSGGIKIFGANNVVRNNRARIRVFSGNVARIGGTINGGKGGHPASGNTVVTNNTGNIVVGDTYSTGNFRYRAQGTELRGNRGSVQLRNHSGTSNGGSGGGANGNVGVSKSRTGAKSGC